MKMNTCNVSSAQGSQNILSVRSAQKVTDTPTQQRTDRVRNRGASERRISTHNFNSPTGRFILLEVHGIPFKSPIAPGGLHQPIRSTMKLHLHLITLFFLSSAPGAAIASNLRAAAGLEDRALQVDATSLLDASQLEHEDLGFVWKLYPSKKFDDRGDDYGVMCRGKECEKNDNIVTGHNQ